MLATPLHTNQSRGRLRLSALTAGNGCCGSLLSARLSAPFVSFMLAPPNRHEERGERRGGFVLVLGACVRSARPCDCVEVWDGGDCVSRMGAFDCLLAILRLSGNTRAGYAGRHRVGSRSGLIVSPPASYPLLLRILCPYCPDPLPRAVSSVPLSACLVLITSRPRPLSVVAPIAVSAISLAYPPITPRLSCRVSGASFLKASNSMPLTSES